MTLLLGCLPVDGKIPALAAEVPPCLVQTGGGHSPSASTWDNTLSHSYPVVPATPAKRGMELRHRPRVFSTTT